MGRFGVTKLVILAVVLLLVVKNSRIDEGLGSGIKEFKNAAKEEPSTDKRDSVNEKKKKSEISGLFSTKYHS
jgi:sec-independent protein translocase protein TatA